MMPGGVDGNGFRIMDSDVEYDEKNETRHPPSYASRFFDERTSTNIPSSEEFYRVFDE